jgi:hypothetical protein
MVAAYQPANASASPSAHALDTPSKMARAALSSPARIEPASMLVMFFLSSVNK